MAEGVADLRVGRITTVRIDLVNFIEPDQRRRIGQLADDLPFPLGRHAVEVEEVQTIGAGVPIAGGNGPQHLGVHHRAQRLETPQNLASGPAGRSGEVSHLGLKGIKTQPHDHQIDQAFFDPLLGLHSQPIRILQSRRHPHRQL